MNFTSCRMICRSGKPFIRKISMSHVVEMNHYTSLGITPSATQDEIKTAYYKLSKKFHPDLNNNSEESTRMFRQITAAYEILGNEKSRKQYDLDNIPSTSQRPVHYYRTKEGFDDESERLFYERTKKKRRVYTGKTDYYDFDMWFDHHYRQNAKNQSYRRQAAGSYDDDLFVRRRKVYTNTPPPGKQVDFPFHGILMILTFFAMSLVMTSSYLEYVQSKYIEELKKKKCNEWKTLKDKER